MRFKMGTYVSCNYFPLQEISYYMRIVIYILFLCAMPLVSFGQKSEAITHLTKDESKALFDKGHSYGSDGMSHNIILNSQTDNFMYKNGTPAKSVGNIDNNYWQYGDNSEHIPPSIADSPQFDNVPYTFETDGADPALHNGVYGANYTPLPQTIFAIPTSASCGSGFISFLTEQRLEFHHLVDSSSCEKLYQEADKYIFINGMQERALDSFIVYIEHCFNQDRAVNVFSDISSMAGQVFDVYVDFRWLELRDWLKSVLYLNLSSEYYCADVLAIINTFQNYSDTTKGGKDNNGLVVLCRFLLEENKCPSYNTYLIDLVADIRKAQLSYWRDTVTDSIKTPIDTSSLTLEELGLGILRGPNQGVVSANHEPRLGELIATRNPFTDILELKYRLAKSGMVRIDVYDLLGRALYAEGQGYKQDGEYVLSLQAKSWSPGSYYVRLSTPNGEVKTVKVVKQ